MKKLLGITLGIMTALGGFVDLGQIVFTTQAGALFRYKLLWSIVLGTVAIIVYMEMCGRVAVVAKEPVFAVVRTRLGYKLGIATLIASNALNLITCAAEIGGGAAILHLLTGWPERTLLIGCCVGIGAFIHISRFQWIERIFGFSGLLMIVFAVSAVSLHPEWSELGRGLLPEVSEARRKSVNEWYDHTLVSRLNDKRSGCIILIMQRLHEDDLVGHVMQQGGWQLLRFPAIADKDEEFVIEVPYA